MYLLFASSLLCLQKRGQLAAMLEDMTGRTGDFLLSLSSNLLICEPPPLLLDLLLLARISDQDRCLSELVYFFVVCLGNLRG